MIKSMNLFCKLLSPMVVATATIVMALVSGCSASDGTGQPSFSSQKKEHKTELISEGPNPAQYDNYVPRGAERITYESDGMKLTAWLMKPTVKGKRPAIVYAHGGDALGAGDVDDARAFVNSGFIVMLPAWRGENGNPGNYEMCYGEVDDAVAAVSYLAERKDVDPSLIFGIGHSIGGTTMLLAAECTDKLAKVAACGALTDMTGLYDNYPNEPFVQNRLEKSLRSAKEHVVNLTCPVLLTYGVRDPGDRSMARKADKFKKLGEKHGKEIEIIRHEEADHFSNLQASIPVIVTFLTSR